MTPSIGCFAWTTWTAIAVQNCTMNAIKHCDGQEEREGERGEEREGGQQTIRDASVAHSLSTQQRVDNAKRPQ